MRKLIFIALIVALLGCAGSETVKQSDRSYPVDTLFSFASIADLGVAIGDTNLVSKSGPVGLLFEKTAQVIQVGWSDVKKPVKKIYLTFQDTQLPPSANPNLPDRWQTREGLYAGMTIEALQQLNGKPFYLKFSGDYGLIWGWENGKLSDSEFLLNLIAKGENKPEAFILSQDIIDRKLDVIVTKITLWPPGSPESNKPKSGGPVGDYPQASTRVLTDGDIAVFKTHELRFARNEIFARHGYIFKNEELMSRFISEVWYGPRFENVEDKLTDIEKQNITLLAAREESLYETRPVTGLMRALPLIHLPIDPEALTVEGVALSRFEEDPDGFVLAENIHEGFDQEVLLVGMLPDTSRYYGVVWFEVTQLQVLAIDYYHSLRLTTFDKKFKRIASTALMVHHSVPDPGSGCSADQEYESALNDDLTFSASLKTVTTCSDIDALNDEDETDDGETSVIEKTVTIAGRVNKDGTISVKYTED